jgi:hypothetical protein
VTEVLKRERSLLLQVAGGLAAVFLPRVLPVLASTW